MTTEQQADTTSLENALAALFHVSVKMARTGIKVVTVRWAEFEIPAIQVATKQDLDKAVSWFNLRLGAPYGSYEHPVADAVGIVDGLHLKVFGPIYP